MVAPGSAAWRARAPWIVTVPLGLLSPDRLRVWLRYAEPALANTTTVGTLYSYQFRGNSVFDPNLTGTGNQPNGYDQWAPAFYQKYVVTASRCRVTTIQNATAGGTSQQIVLIPSASALTYSTVEDGAADARGQLKSLGMGPGAEDVVHDLTATTSQVVGVPESNVTADPNLSALYSANPVTAWNWNYLSQTSASATASAYVVFELWYLTEFYSRTERGAD